MYVDREAVAVMLKQCPTEGELTLFHNRMEKMKDYKRTDQAKFICEFLASLIQLDRCDYYILQISKSANYSSFNENSNAKCNDPWWEWAGGSRHYLQHLWFVHDPNNWSIGQFPVILVQYIIICFVNQSSSRTKSSGKLRPLILGWVLHPTMKMSNQEAMGKMLSNVMMSIDGTKRLTGFITDGDVSLTRLFQVYSTTTTSLSSYQPLMFVYIAGSTICDGGTFAMRRA